MNEVYIDIRADDELQELFKQDFVSVEELRNKLVDLFNQINCDNEDNDFEEYMEVKRGN